MKKWYGYVQFNGDDVSIFEKTEFDVTDEEYAEIQKAIASNTPLTSLANYDELENRILESFDLAEYLGLDDEKPEEEDFDDEEEYEEELENYEEYCDDKISEYSLASVAIDDPGDFERLKEQFVGQTIDGADEDIFLETEEDGERWVKYELDIQIEDGVIKDLNNLKVNALQSESISTSSWSENCYPNYEFLAEVIQEYIGGQDEEEE